MIHRSIASARRLLPLLAIALLSACAGKGGDGSGGSIALGSGQPGDPGTVDFPVAYVKRTVPLRQDDLRQQRDAVPDADVWVRDRGSPSSPERNITERITKTDRYDVRDLDVSYDGAKLIFAMRGPLAMNQDEEDPPTWAIWEYEFRTDTLRRVIRSDTIAAEGNDVAPHYLPDGRIVFSSTRQRQSQAVLRDEGKPGFEAQAEGSNESAFVLHVMNADGSDIHQISFGQSHDLDPSVLSSGRVMWTRWDASSGRGMHLYTANPDGTDLQLLYGAHSHDTGSDPAQPVQFVRAREMHDGRVLALQRPMTNTDFGGRLVIVDVRNYVENTQPVLASAGLAATAQVNAMANDVRTVEGPSPGGRFNSAFPLWDGTRRILVTWTQCRLLEANARIVPCTDDRLAAAGAVTAPVIYGAFVFDPNDNTMKPMFTPQEGVMVTDLVAAQPRTLPTVVLDRIPVLDFDPTLQSEGVGILDIRSVYDLDGVDGAAPDAPDIATLANPASRTADQRRARFLRIEKAVSQPDNAVRDIDATAFGASPFMREILGYAPIEPDGSVRVRVPANVAFRVSVVDRDARRIFPQHRVWLQLRPGETKRCNGCHVAGTARPEKAHGRDGLFPAAWAGAAATGVPFPGTVAQFSPDAGETMAQARARWSCANEGCRSMKLTADVRYEDVWTNASTAGRTPDPAFSYTYTGLPAPPRPPACATDWSSTCRIVVNYAQHVHPLWSQPRLVQDGNGNVVADHTCTSCHGARDANGAARVPAGQLDLSDGDSDEVPTQKRAYRELLFPDNAQEVNMGAVTDTQVTTIDPATGQPVTSNVGVSPPLLAGNARGSTRFFDRFAATGDHAGWLTPGELRLLSEWVDIGAQYFNNPFDPAVPLN